MLFCVRTGAAILEVKLFTAPGVHIRKFGPHLRVFISFLMASFKILQGHVRNSLLTTGMEHTTYTFQKRCGSVVHKVNGHKSGPRLWTTATAHFLLFHFSALFVGMTQSMSESEQGILKFGEPLQPGRCFLSLFVKKAYIHTECLPY